MVAIAVPNPHRSFVLSRREKSPVRLLIGRSGCATLALVPAHEAHYRAGMRTLLHGADELFTRRWSPRAMSGEPIATEELLRLFEAARWAPSAANQQPWRFLYARRDTPSWPRFLDLLNEGNRVWCVRAAALVVVLSKATRITHEGKTAPLPTHSFDAGAAWASLALQGTISGLVVHGMGGFDKDRARKDLEVPEDFAIECMVAVGKHGNISDLPEKVQATEKPNDRRPLDETVFEGSFPVR